MDVYWKSYSANSRWYSFDGMTWFKYTTEALFNEEKCFYLTTRFKHSMEY